MPEADDLRAVVREWILKAESDLLSAVHLLKLGSECPTDSVAFHAQQCAEKYLKALLVLHEVHVPKTHDLARLVQLFPSTLQLAFEPEEQEVLTSYAAGARYPGWPEIPLAQARRSVAIARRLRREIRSLMPAVILRGRVPKRKRGKK